MTIIDRRYSVAEGTAIKAPCRAATTANITLSGLQTIDGVVVVEEDRVLVMNQTDGTTNGIYAASSGNWLRTRDFDGAYDIVCGTRVFVTTGTANAQVEFYVTTADPIVIDTTSIAFSAVSTLAVQVAMAIAAQINLGWTGPATFAQTVAITGNLSVNTNKFTVTASNGNTSVAGTLAVAGALSAGSGITSTLAGNFAINAATGQQVVLGAVGGTGLLVINSGSNVVYPSPDNTVSLGNTLARFSAVHGMALVGYTSILSPGTGGVGYATGAGGAVTQSTNKSTGVTLNRPSGQITMNNAAMTTNTIVSFVLTNSAIVATDVLVLNIVSGTAAPGQYNYNAACSNGSATITIKQNGATTLSDALVFQFALIKGATS